MKTCSPIYAAGLLNRENKLPPIMASHSITGIASFVKSGLRILGNVGHKETDGP
jgi:hypothetical protein